MTEVRGPRVSVADADDLASEDAVARRAALRHLVASGGSPYLLIAVDQAEARLTSYGLGAGGIPTLLRYLADELEAGAGGAQ